MLVDESLEDGEKICPCWAMMNESKSQRLKLMAEGFSEWLEAINYSPKTRVNYTRDVKHFLAWLRESTAINSIVEVTPAQLQQYQIALYNFARHDDKEAATKEKQNRSA